MVGSRAGGVVHYDGCKTRRQYPVEQVVGIDLLGASGGQLVQNLLDGVAGAAILGRVAVLIRPVTVEGSIRPFPVAGVERGKLQRLSWPCGRGSPS